MPTFPDITHPLPPSVLREQLVYKFEVERFGKLELFAAPRVRILIVTDASGSFDRIAQFGLGKAIDAMRSDPWWWVRFEITTAHRSAFSAAEKAANKHPDLLLHDGFNFATPPSGLALNNFDEIWLFGVSSSASLSAAEVTALSSYMDSGRGVFATGDHSTLGAGLCGDLPRIDKMRKWKTGGPSGSPPPQFGSARHDTLREGASPGFQFNDQSDNTPQPIYVTRYYDPFRITRLLSRWRPHPVLCGIYGVIDVLPDHMHEGEVVAPSAIDPAEFPNGIKPEVIAYATVLSHRTPGTSSDPSDTSFSTPKTFGVLGAYDGHLATRGRVVTDATWHHWFNVNLIGFANGDANYEKIKNYFWNVGLWLAPTGKQDAMRHAALHGLVYVQPFNETLWPTDLVRLGFDGVDAIGRRASQCLATDWALDLVSPKLKELAWRRPFPPFPPEPPNPPDPPDPPFEMLEDLREYVIGGALQQLLARREEGKLGPDDVPELVKRGAQKGLAALLEDGRKRMRRADETMTLLREIGITG